MCFKGASKGLKFNNIYEKNNLHLKTFWGLLELWNFVLVLTVSDMFLMFPIKTQLKTGAKFTNSYSLFQDVWGERVKKKTFKYCLNDV